MASDLKSQGMNWREKYSADLASGLLNLRCSQQYTDVEVKVGEMVFYCHRVILCAMSEYFHMMMQHPMKESKSGTITLENDEDVVEAVLNYIYTGDIVVTEQNVYKLFDAAQCYMLPSLSLQCQEFLTSGITKDNCVGIWKVVGLHGCREVADKAWYEILKTFSDILENEDFLQLPSDDLKQILEDPLLNCSDDHLKCRAVVRWLEADLDQRHIHILDLFMHLLHLKVTFETINEEVRGSQSLAGMPVCLEHLEAIRKMTFMSLVPSPAGEYDNCFIMIGGKETGENKNISCFSFKDRRWLELPPLARDPGFFFAVCSLNDLLFLSGGSVKRDQFLCYSGTKGVWKQFPDLIEERQRHCMQTVKGGIYILGGHSGIDDSTATWEVDRFNIEQESWDNVGQLAVRVHSPSVAVLGTNIFLFGGRNMQETGRGPSNIIQMFNTEQRYGSKLDAKLPITTKGPTLGAVTMENTIVLIMFMSGKGVAFSFDGRSTPKQIGEVERCPKKEYGIARYDNKILLVGGESEEMRTLKSMVLYNPDSGVSIELPERLHFEAKNFGHATMYIRRSFLKTDVA
ncbi:hypothetical protein ACJMK2_037152 [Sinanodonta woodiana]|uniref:BTB domain-containing protein n=1 Tax=Sinanodonta woodiana TaxID=1069815 RepID=A0ABD3WJE5_SINWO